MTALDVGVELRLTGGHTVACGMTLAEVSAFREGLAAGGMVEIPEVVAVDKTSNYGATTTTVTRRLVRASSVVSMTITERTVERRS